MRATIQAVLCVAKWRREIICNRRKKANDKQQRHNKFTYKERKGEEEECTLRKAAWSLRKHQFMKITNNVNTESTNETPLSND